MTYNKVDATDVVSTTDAVYDTAGAADSKASGVESIVVESVTGDKADADNGVPDNTLSSNAEQNPSDKMERMQKVSSDQKEYLVITRYNISKFILMFIFELGKSLINIFPEKLENDDKQLLAFLMGISVQTVNDSINLAKMFNQEEFDGLIANHSITYDLLIESMAFEKSFIMLIFNNSKTTADAKDKINSLNQDLIRKKKNSQNNTETMGKETKKGRKKNEFVTI